MFPALKARTARILATDFEEEMDAFKYCQETGTVICISINNLSYQDVFLER